MPHPFSNVIDYERRIQQPVGRTWNNVATFKKLVKPKIVTKLGKVIEPIDKSETFKKPQFDTLPSNSSGKSKTGRSSSSSNSVSHRPLRIKRK